MSSAFEDAARFADFWTGSDLVAYEPVAIPMFLVALEVVVQRKKPIPPIDEFALRVVNQGVMSLDAVSGFLGLEARLSEEAILNQLQASNLTYQPSVHGDRELLLTSRGVEALGELASFVPERQEIQVVYDRMTRSVRGIEDRGMVRPAGLEVRSLRPRPPVGPPGPRDISADDVNAALAKSEGLQRVRRTAAAEFQLIGIKRIVRSERRYKRATLLVYQDRQSHRLQAGIVVDGRPSRDHTQAMGELGGLGYLEINDASITPRRAYREALRLLPGIDQTKIAADTEVADAIRSFALARRRLRDPDADIGAGQGEGLTGREAARSAYEEAGRRLMAWHLRRVPCWEHCLLLEWAVATSSQRILVSSPRITDEAAGYELLRQLEDAAARGVSVTLVIPPRPQKVPRGEEDARRRLQDLASRRSRINLVESPTAASSLVWDETWVAGTFSWLGHSGDPDHSLVSHESILVRDRTRADATFTHGQSGSDDLWELTPQR